MESTNTAFCRECNKQVHFHVNAINHWQQFLITLLTLGIWLPIWLAMVLYRTRFCDECGNPIWRE